MAFRLSEPAATAIAERLVADLPAAITARNDGITDGFTLAEPGEVFPFVPSAKRLSVVGYEAIGIGRLKTEFQDDIGVVVTGTHDLPIITYLADPDAEALAVRLERMLQVVTGVVMRDRDLPIDNFEGMGLRRIDYGPTWDAEEDPRLVRSFGVLTVWVRTEDS